MNKLALFALLTMGCTSMAHDPIAWAMDIVDSRFGDQIPEAYELDHFEKCQLLTSGIGTQHDDDLIRACAILTNEGDEQ